MWMRKAASGGSVSAVPETIRWIVSGVNGRSPGKMIRSGGVLSYGLKNVPSRRVSGSI